MDIQLEELYELQNNNGNVQQTFELVRSVLEAMPEKFTDCLPVLRKVVNDGYGNMHANIIKISKQFMRSYPLECAKLFIDCTDRYSYGAVSSWADKYFAANVMEILEPLIEVTPALNQEMSQKLIDAISDASYYSILYNHEPEKKDWKEKRAGIYLKILRTKAFSEEVVMSVLNKVDEDEKSSFAQIILAEKLCTSKQAAEILTDFKARKFYNKIEKLAQQNYSDDNEVKTLLKNIKIERRNKKIIDEVLYEYPAGPKVEALIRLADTIIKTKDDKKINQFKEMLFCRGEEFVFAIDKKAMDWFVNNGKPEDLDALNNLSQLYGIKTTLDEYWTVDPAQNAAYRIRFDGGYNEIGAVQDNGRSNPHYYRMLSEGYRKFEPDYSRDFKPSEYNWHENKAFQILAEKGVKMPIKMLQAACAKIHMPPEIAKGLNATDLQHLLVNYVNHNQGYSCYDNLMESIKAKGSGRRMDMQKLSSKAPAPIREKLWKAYAGNQQLVEFVSKDWERMGINTNTINDTWENAKQIGAPVEYYSNGLGRTKASHYGMRNTLHHALALRVGGTNDQSIIITNNIAQARAGTYDTYARDGGKFAINSHDPFHHYDNPCVYLYLKTSDGKLSVKEKADGRMKKRMMVTRIPSVKMDDGEKMVYYGGPRECSCAIMDKNGNVRQASYEFWKDSANGKYQVQESLKEAKMSIKR